MGPADCVPLDRDCVTGLGEPLDPAVYSRQRGGAGSVAVTAHAILRGESTRNRSQNGIREMTRTEEEVSST
jgi:hypothetical protein